MVYGPKIYGACKFWKTLNEKLRRFRSAQNCRCNVVALLTTSQVTIATGKQKQ